MTGNPFFIKPDYEGEYIMTYVVKDNNSGNYLEFNRFVRDMDIITETEQVISIESASTFESQESANQCIQEAKSFMDEDEAKELNWDILDKDVTKTLAKEQAEQKEKDNKTKAWANTEEDVKQRILQKRYDNGESLEEIEKFLDDVNDKASISLINTSPYRNYEQAFKAMESILGRPLTDTEKDEYIENLTNQ